MVLSIVFNDGQFAAFNGGQEIKPLNFNGNNHVVEYNGHPADALKENMNAIQDQFEKETGSAVTNIGLVFPTNCLLDESIKAKIELVAESVHGARVLSSNNFASALAIGKTGEDGDVIVLETTVDGQTNLSYATGSNAPSSVLLKDFGSAKGKQRVVDALISDLGKRGLVINQEGEQQFMQQVGLSNAEAYTFEKKSDNVEIHAKVSLDDAQFADLILGKKSVLNQYIHKNVLKSNNAKVITTGNFFKNEALQSFIKDELAIADRIEDCTGMDFGNLAAVASVPVVQEAMGVLAAERKEAKRKAMIEAKRQQMAAKEALLSEIRSTVADFEKEEEYKAMFIPKGEAIGIPKEVVNYHIDECISNLLLENEIVTPDTKAEIAVEAMRPEPVVQPKPQPKVEVKPTPKPEPIVIKKEAPKAAPKPAAKAAEVVTKAAPKKVVVQTATKAASVDEVLGKVFVTEQALNGDFNYRNGKVKGMSGLKTLRFLSDADARDSKKAAQFTQLHKNESDYYEGVSPTFPLDGGKYYFRNATQGDDLETFMAKLNLKNSRPDRWSTSETTFVLKVIKAIKDLNVGIEDFNAKKMFIVSKSKWPLKKEYQIIVEGFTANADNKSNTENQLHTTLNNLLGANTYTTFRKKFNL